jgi:hypothetical protein
MECFITVLDRADSDLYHYFFRVPENIAEKFIDKEDRRVVCVANGQLKFHSAILSDGAGGKVITFNQSRVKKLGLPTGEEFQIEMEKDNSNYGMPISEELLEVLDQDHLANKLFHNLTRGRQRTLIYWSDNVKSSEIKIRRALVMTNHLVVSEGDIDFKQLNVEMKEANQFAKLSKN